MRDRLAGLEVRTARPEERPVVAAVLEFAFRDDPVICWLCPRLRRRRDLFRLLVEHHHAVPGYADLALLGGEPVGAALWDPPGHRLSPAEEVRAVPRSLRALGSDVWRGLVLERELARHTPSHPFWHLAELGAALPGRGIGGALLEQRLSAISGPAYLESTNAANLPLYARHGFIARAGERLPSGGPAYWPMDRPAPS